MGGISNVRHVDVLPGNLRHSFYHVPAQVREVRTIFGSSTQLPTNPIQIAKATKITPLEKSPRWKVCQYLRLRSLVRNIPSCESVSVPIPSSPTFVINRILDAQESEGEVHQ